MGMLREHLRCMAVALAFATAGASVARAEHLPPTLGLGVGFGEHGTFGVNFRARVAGRVGLEAGGGLYYYRLDEQGTRISGFEPCWGAELLWYFTAPSSPTQHAVGLVYEGQQVLGHQYGVSYRCEGPLGASGIGYHVELGLLYGPQARDRADAFFQEETGKKPHDLDLRYLPMLVKAGVHF